MTPREIRKLEELLSRLVCARDIAKLAGVGQSTVNNWIMRHADFPPAVAKVGPSRLFVLDDVCTWIDAHDYALTNGRRGYPLAA
jgi:predicted DNA-binding transcriptional regulator AlpA